MISHPDRAYSRNPAVKADAHSTLNAGAQFFCIGDDEKHGSFDEPAWFAGASRRKEDILALLKIARMGHPVLLRPALPVESPGAPEIASLVRDMIETMLDASGAGLAAPQVHHSLRLFVYHVPAARCDDGEEALAPRALINPVISPVGEERMDCVEGCLSLPGLRGVVRRHVCVRYEGWNERGEAVSGEARGFHANVLQHENDHLDGILYTMRIDDFRSFGYTDELMRENPT